MPLIAKLRPIDQARTGRLLIAWRQGDTAAADLVLAEAQDDPIGVPGLVFGLAELASDLMVRVAPDDHLDQLRRAVLVNTIADEPEDGIAD